MPRRARPTPEAALAAARDRRAREAEIARLTCLPDVKVTLDAGRRIVSARRLDVFDQLLAQRALTEVQAEAARRLETDLAAAAGVDRASGGLERVDACAVGAPGQGVTQSMVDAAARVRAALAACGPVNARLLTALLEPQFGGNGAGREAWRATVARVTGEAGRDAAGALVRSACENLRAVYAEQGYRRAGRLSPRPRPGGSPALCPSAGPGG